MEKLCASRGERRSIYGRFTVYKDGRCDGNGGKKKFFFSTFSQKTPDLETEPVREIEGRVRDLSGVKEEDFRELLSVCENDLAREALDDCERASRLGIDLATRCGTSFCKAEFFLVLGSSLMLRARKRLAPAILRESISALSQAYHISQQEIFRSALCSGLVLLVEMHLARREPQDAQSALSLLRHCGDDDEQKIHGLTEKARVLLNDPGFRSNVYDDNKRRYVEVLERDANVPVFSGEVQGGAFLRGKHLRWTKFPHGNAGAMFVEVELEEGPVIVRVGIDGKKAVNDVECALKIAGEGGVWSAVGEVVDFVDCPPNSYFSTASKLFPGKRLLQVTLKALFVSAGVAVSPAGDDGEKNRIARFERVEGELKNRSLNCCLLCFNAQPIASHVFPGSILKRLHIQRGLGFGSESSQIFTLPLFCNPCDSGVWCGVYESRFRTSWLEPVLEWEKFKLIFPDGEGGLRIPVSSFAAYTFCFSLFFRFLCSTDYEEDIDTFFPIRSFMHQKLTSVSYANMEVWSGIEREFEQRFSCRFSIGYLRDESQFGEVVNVPYALSFDATAYPVFGDQQILKFSRNTSGKEDVVGLRIGRFHFVMSKGARTFPVEWDGLWNCSIIRPEPFLVVLPPSSLRRSILMKFWKSEILSIPGSDEMSKSIPAVRAFFENHFLLRNNIILDICLPEGVEFHNDDHCFAVQAHWGRRVLRVTLDKSHINGASGYSFMDVWQCSSQRRLLFCICVSTAGSSVQDKSSQKNPKRLVCGWTTDFNFGSFIFPWGISTQNRSISLQFFLRLRADGELTVPVCDICFLHQETLLSCPCKERFYCSSACQMVSFLF